MSKMANLFEKMESRFDPIAAKDLDVVFQFNIDDNIYNLAVSNGVCVAAKGEHNDPTVTLILDKDTLEDIISGELSGTKAFLSGRLRTEGDMMLATRLSELFKM